MSYLLLETVTKLSLAKLWSHSKQLRPIIGYKGWSLVKKKEAMVTVLVGWKEKDNQILNKFFFKYTNIMTPKYCISVHLNTYIKHQH